MDLRKNVWKALKGRNCDFQLKLPTMMMMFKKNSRKKWLKIDTKQKARLNDNLLNVEKKWIQWMWIDNHAKRFSVQFPQMPKDCSKLLIFFAQLLHKIYYLILW